MSITKSISLRMFIVHVTDGDNEGCGGDGGDGLAPFDSIVGVWAPEI